MVMDKETHRGDAMLRPSVLEGGKAALKVQLLGCLFVFLQKGGVPRFSTSYGKRRTMNHEKRH